MNETKKLMSSLCWRLGIGDPRYIEIEAKKRVLPEEAKPLKKHLLKLKKIKHLKQVSFFDQYLDTLDPATRKGCFGTAMKRLVRETNSAAMSGDAKAKKIATHAAKLKAKVLGA